MFSIIGSGMDISKMGKPVLDIQGNLVYEPKKLNDPEFVDFLLKPLNPKNEFNNSKNINPDYLTDLSNHSLYEIGKIPENKNQSVRDYLTQKFTAIQGFKDASDNQN